MCVHIEITIKILSDERRRSSLSSFVFASRNCALGSSSIEWNTLDPPKPPLKRSLNSLFFYAPPMLMLISSASVFVSLSFSFRFKGTLRLSYREPAPEERDDAHHQHHGASVLHVGSPGGASGGQTMPHNINISKDHVQMNHTLLLRPTKVLFSSSSCPPRTLCWWWSLFESSAM